MKSMNKNNGAGKKKNPHAVALGRKGGKKTLDRLGKEHFSKAGKISAEKRQRRKQENG